MAPRRGTRSYPRSRKGPRPKYVWGSIDATTTITTGQVLNVDLMSDLRARLPSLVGLTLVRLIMNTTVTGTGAPQYVFAVIKAIAPHLSDLFTADVEGFGWLFRKRQQAPTGIDGNLASVDVDVKPNRRLDREQDTIFAIVDNLSAVTLTISMAGRALVRLP